MNDDSQMLVLVRALDRLRICADGLQTEVCLTSKECLKVCTYIYWLTDMIVREESRVEKD